MKKTKNRIISLLIISLSILAFTGCGNGGKENEGEAQNREIVLTVGDIEISFDEVMIYADLLRSEYESMYGANIWAMDFGEYTFEDMAKESIIEQVTQIRLSSVKAKELGVSLTDDEKAEAEEMAAAHYEELVSQGAQGTLTKELLLEVYTENYLAQKVYEYVVKDVDTDVSDEEAKQITVQHFLVMAGYYDDEDELIPFSDEEKEEAREKAEKLLAEAKKAEDFEAFAEENTEDPGGVEYTFGKGDMDTAFEEAAFGLKPGEISGLVESTYGYHVIYCVSDFDEEATAEKKEELIIEKQDEAFVVIYEEWKTEYPVVINEELWSTVTFISEDDNGDGGFEWEIEEDEAE